MASHDTDTDDFLLRLSLSHDLTRRQKKSLCQPHPSRHAMPWIPAPIRQTLAQVDKQALLAAQHWLKHPRHHLLTIHSPNYPERLKQIDDPPPFLYIDGQLDSLTENTIALVGSRNPTPPGRQLAAELSMQLCQVPMTTCSGLALGIDACVHQATLNSGGQTIAVLGCGINVRYPRANQKLFQSIPEHGAIISEYPWGSPPKRHHFPQRNRLISGLSLGVIVVEASLRSGSLITAKWALEQNREIFAIPGPIHSPLHKGCHFLIKQGAKLVESVEDIVVELPAKAAHALPRAVEVRKKSIQNNKKELDGCKQMLIEYLQSQPASLAQLQMQGLMPVPILAKTLIDWEVDGKIQQHNGKYFWKRSQ